MSIEVGLTEPQPLEVTFEEISAGVEVSVDSNPVIIEFPTPPEIQVAVNEVYQTNGGGGSGKSPYIGGNGNWFYYNDVTQQYIDSGVKARGNPGKTAYQSAVDGGYTNTEPQFNTDLSQANNKVDKVAGKGLSTNDFTNTLKDKLDSTEIFTLAEKTQGALATGNAALDTVKKVADYVANLNHKLIASFVPTVGSNIFETDRDNEGVLLSTFNIKKCYISIYCTSSATAIQTGFLRINDVSTFTYKTTGNYISGLFFRNNAETYQCYDLDFVGIFKCASYGIHSPTIQNDNTAVALVYPTINRAIVDKKLEKLTLILGGGATFGVNSIINIWTL